MIFDKYKLDTNSSEKKIKYDVLTKQRIDFLYNIHKEKEQNIKKLESNINIVSFFFLFQESGITFRPKLNDEYNIMNRATSYSRLEKTDFSANKINLYSLRPSDSKENTLKQSSSIRQISNKISPRKSDNLKHKTSSHGQNYLQNSPLYRENYISPKTRTKFNEITISPSEKKISLKKDFNYVKTASTRYSVQNSKDFTNNLISNNAINSVNKNIITTENQKSNDKVEYL